MENSVFDKLCVPYRCLGCMLSELGLIWGRIPALRHLDSVAVEVIVTAIATVSGDTALLKSEADIAVCNKMVDDAGWRVVSEQSVIAVDIVAVAAVETSPRSICHAQHRSQCEIAAVSPRRSPRCTDDDEQMF